MTNPDVIVVGGGIGGLSAAFGLARAGLQVRVLEQAPEFGEVGAGLQVAPNCTRILDDYGLLDEVKSLGVLPTAMVMKDAVDGTELTRLDLVDLERHYGFPYLVIHRSDLHATFLRACQRAGVDLRTNARIEDYESTADGATVMLADRRTESAPLVIAADGLHSVARDKYVADQPVNSSYVAYRGTVPVDDLGDRDVDLSQVSVYIGPKCHFVHYALRSGEMLNQVAVFESPKAIAGQEDWGAPEELDHAFDGMHENIQDGLPYMWRDKWWRMFDRDPIDTWVYGRVALLGDAAHPPLQYMAQGAIMAIEDGWVLAKHAASRMIRTESGITVDWEAVLAAYQAVRPEHCRRVLITGRAWGDLWHLDGTKREQRNALLRARDTYDYYFTDWIYGPTALREEDEVEMFTPIPLSSA
ncbi:FAD-dependent oxidoreductase [Actinomadura coerulea]|uniref:FAD-dependent oxidoreductase n=1 Tax=Actinomadura coerulea TaxID=46159 RepID=UPI003430856F